MRGRLRVVLVGVAIDTLIALALGCLAASVLHGRSPRDPVVLSVVATTLVAVAVAACPVPA